MPGLDDTGSQDVGAMTRRGLGYCGRHNRCRFNNPTPDLRGVHGLGHRERGRGWRNRFYVTGSPGWVPPTPEQEITDLNTWAEQHKVQLDAIQKRIEELKT